MADKKYIVYFDSKNERIESCKSVYQDNVPEHKLSIIKTLWACLTEKGFLYKFTQTLKYALRHADCYRDDGSANVFLFQMTKNYDNIWRKK
jgi:hypothetical protein